MYGGKGEDWIRREGGEERGMYREDEKGIRMYREKEGKGKSNV